MENEKMERLTKGKFKKNPNSKNNSTILGNSILKKTTSSIFAPFVQKFVK